mmetsp:Transcript_13874/g.29604  ORF Transcript_13874/g.29604 Transcript_13874/m.29604 type:complete len:109 (-) Transcript_13874:222-548(-)
MPAWARLSLVDHCPVDNNGRSEAYSKRERKMSKEKHCASFLFIPRLDRTINKPSVTIIYEKCNSHIHSCAGLNQKRRKYCTANKQTNKQKWNRHLKNVSAESPPSLFV